MAAASFNVSRGAATEGLSIHHRRFAGALVTVLTRPGRCPGPRPNAKHKIVSEAKNVPEPRHHSFELCFADSANRRPDDVGSRDPRGGGARRRRPSLTGASRLTCPSADPAAAL